MIRIVSLAAALACLSAAPAFAEGVRLSLAGKTPEQIQADIVTTARRACNQDSSLASLSIELRQACVRDTAAATTAQIGEARLAAGNKTVASR